MERYRIESQRRPVSLVKPISFVLIVKLIALFLLWILFFGPDTRLDQTSESTATRFLEQSPTSFVTTEEPS